MPSKPDAEWHDRRRKGIGGSDANFLVHYPGRWRDLWEVKTGRRDEDDLSGILRVQLGKETEALNLRFFQKASSLVVHSVGVEFVHPKLAFMRGTFDALVGDDAIVECKHTSEGKNLEGVAEYYRPQLHHYAYVAQRGVVYLSVFFGNARHEYKVVSLDSGFTQHMLVIEREFWHYVETDKAPPKWK